MNAKTTAPAHRMIQTEAGKMSVPASFPTAQEIQTLSAFTGSNPFARQVVTLARNIIAAGPAGMSSKDRATAWEVIPENWRELMAAAEEARAEAAQEAANATARMADRNAPARYPDCLPPIEGDALAELETLYKQAPLFQKVDPRTYSRLYFGAACSRRGGLDWRIWANRVRRFYPRGLVLLIAGRAYSAPTADICAIGEI